jgi:hypothetical protein
VLANAVGELAGWAVLAAVTASAGSRDVDTLTAEWCRERLYDTIRTTEQALPGEASHLDSLLAR